MKQFRIVVSVIIVVLATTSLLGCARETTVISRKSGSEASDTAAVASAPPAKKQVVEDPFKLIGTWQRDDGGAIILDEDGTYSMRADKATWGGSVYARGTWTAESYEGSVVKVDVAPTHEYVQLFDGEKPAKGLGIMGPMAKSFGMKLKETPEGYTNISGPNYGEFERAQRDVDAALGKTGSATYTDIKGESHSIEGTLVPTPGLKQLTWYLVLQGDEMAFFNEADDAVAGKKPRATYSRQK